MFFGYLSKVHNILFIWFKRRDYRHRMFYTYVESRGKIIFDGKVNFLYYLYPTNDYLAVEIATLTCMPW